MRENVNMITVQEIKLYELRNNAFRKKASSHEHPMTTYRVSSSFFNRMAKDFARRAGQSKTGHGRMRKELLLLPHLPVIGCIKLLIFKDRFHLI